MRKKYKEKTDLPQLEHRWNVKKVLKQKVEIIKNYNTEEKTIGIKHEQWEVKADGESVVH